jgi:hypothetical protein
MHVCARLCGIPPGCQRRDRLRLQDRSPQGRLTSTEDNKYSNQEIIHSLRSAAIEPLIAGASWTDVPARSAAFLVNIGRMGGVSKEKLEEVLKSYNKNALITAAIHAGGRSRRQFRETRASRYLTRWAVPQRGDISDLQRSSRETGL